MDGRRRPGDKARIVVKTGPFHSLLAAGFVAAVAAGAPAVADERPQADAGSAPAESGAVRTPPKTGAPMSTTLNGLHLKLGKIELKVRGPVVLDTGSGEAAPSKPADNGTAGQ